jgi:hypothetical protein
MRQQQKKIGRIFGSPNQGGIEYIKGDDDRSLDGLREFSRQGLRHYIRHHRPMILK